MQFRIGEATYDVAALNRASLTDLLNLKKFTTLGFDEIEAGLAKLATYEDNPSAVLSDIEALMALGALIWLTRWKAGDRLDFETACDFPLDDFEIVTEASDVPAETPAPDADPS